MSKNVQKHLACHDYHMGNCPQPKGQCPYSHVGTSYGICPNKNYCTTPHKLVTCPLLLTGGCPIGDACSYRHEEPKPAVPTTTTSSARTTSPSTNPTTEEESKESTTNHSAEDSSSESSLAPSLNIRDEIDMMKLKILVKQRTMQDFRSGLLELHRDLQILAPYYKESEFKIIQKFSSMGLDMCFLVDITGSMSSWIDQTLNYIRTTFQSIQDDFDGIGLRIAFCGYRDYCDSERFVLQDFTSNIDQFSTFLSKVRCSGGGDTAEDVAGGLKRAIDLDWKSQARQVIFIADSPAHGSKYHSGVSDDYQQGDPAGLLIESLMKIYKQKGIEFTAIEINSSTDIMFKIMRQSFGNEMSIKSLKSGGGSGRVNGGVKGGEDSGTFSSVIHDSVKKTITDSVSKNSLGEVSGGADSAKNSRASKIAQAYKLIMQNKKYKNSVSQTSSKTKAGNILQATLCETKVLEEDEFESDDSDYENKLTQTCERQFKEAQLEKKQRIAREAEQRIEKLKTEFPAHYFQTYEESESLTMSKKAKKKIKIQKVDYLKGPINWDNFASYCDFQAICHSFELVRNARGGTEINWKHLQVRTFFLGTKVRLSNLVFSEGAMRYAYHAKDLYLKQRMVAKQYRKIEKQEKMTIEDMKRDILTQIVCKYIVKEFNSKLANAENRRRFLSVVDSNEAGEDGEYDEEEQEVEEEEETKVDYKSEELSSLPALQFIDSYIYEMTFPRVAVPLFYFEKHIEGSYEKFNNNSGYVADSTNIFSQLAQTLSHFSWQLSKGYLAMVDLQGNDSGILTDPQIHCLDSEKFGDGNLAYEGILRFFTSHKCNEYCHALQLIHPLITPRLSEMNTFFSDARSSSINVKHPERVVFHLCDVCQTSKQFTVMQTMESERNNTRLTCKECVQEIAASTLTKDCAGCKTVITFSTYECIQLRRDIPILCETCTIATEKPVYM